MLKVNIEFPERTFKCVELKAAPRRGDLIRMEDDSDVVYSGEIYEVEWTPDLDFDLIVRVRDKEK